MSRDGGISSLSSSSRERTRSGVEGQIADIRRYLDGTKCLYCKGKLAAPRTQFWCKPTCREKDLARQKAPVRKGKK
jgi:hypothetical protein